MATMKKIYTALELLRENGFVNIADILESIEMTFATKEENNTYNTATYYMKDDGVKEEQTSFDTLGYHLAKVDGLLDEIDHRLSEKWEYAAISDIVEPDLVHFHFYVAPDFTRHLILDPYDKWPWFKASVHETKEA